MSRHRAGDLVRLRRGRVAHVVAPFGRPDDGARFTLYAPLSGSHGTVVEIEWMDGRKVDSTINGTPTPYTQCTRLIRSPEGDSR